jgi:hypothetical protein
MGDVYEGSIDPKLEGHRHASPGADDNYSATAALMEAARVFKQLSLKRDVWLVHLTGEEYPADCLGARALSEALVTQKSVIDARRNPKIIALYVLDMIAHNTDRDHVPYGKHAPSIFQIAPGRGERAAGLAVNALEATLSWNQEVAAKAVTSMREWERSPGPKPPRLGTPPKLRAEIRPWWHYRSTLYNTDGQIFSDAGIPTVLFMENYDIDRKGYHDTHDTLANIDLDYGSGVSRIAIEAVARMAERQ